MISNPWRDLPSSEPYVLPIDAEAIERFNAKASETHRLRLEIVPEPFLGRPDANLVLLNGNPGFVDDDRAVHLDVAFNAAARANLTHQATPPLYLLDEKRPSPGGEWWSQRLRPLAEAVPDVNLAERIFVAEVHGYHSRRYKHIKLPSQRYTIELVRRAIDRGATIIVMRAYRTWLRLVPELAASSTYRLNSPQNVTISRRNCPGGFDASVAAVRREFTSS